MRTTLAAHSFFVAFPFALTGVVLLASAMACHDTSRFSNRADHYEGTVVKGAFVRSGMDENVRMCVTLDADHLQDAPGTLTTSDGRFQTTALRPLPQIWHDPLSTLSFGDGRKSNLLYAVAPVGRLTGDTADVMVIVSLMDTGGIEVRVMRGAPAIGGSDASAAPAPPLFGIFALERAQGSCSF